MSDQGEAPEPRAGQRDDWWSQLYDPGAPDTGRSAADDTIDDRFAAARAVGASGSREPLAASAAGPADPADPAEPADPAAAGADSGEDYGEGVRDVYPGADVDVSADPYPGPDTDPDTDTAPEDPGVSDEDLSPAQRPAVGRWRSVRAAVGHAGRQRVASTVSRPTRRRLLPPEPGELADADPGSLSDLVPDTVLDGARYDGLVLRAVSGRGGSARQRGEPRGDALLTACFGRGTEALLFAAVAVGAGTADPGRRAAREVCRAIGEAVGRSRARLVEDIATHRRPALSSGLKRLTDRCYGQLRAQAAALSLPPEAYTADLRCLLLPADPECRARVVFGTGGGGLFRLRDEHWADLEPDEEGTTGHLPDPRVPERDGEEGGPVSPPFRFRLVTAAPGDTLLLCSAGLAVPLRGDPTFADTLASSWSQRAEPPDLAEFLTCVQHPAPAYGDDRTAVAIWH